MSLAFPLICSLCEKVCSGHSLPFNGWLARTFQLSREATTDLMNISSFALIVSGCGNRLRVLFLMCDTMFQHMWAYSQRSAIPSDELTFSEAWFVERSWIGGGNSIVSIENVCLLSKSRHSFGVGFTPQCGFLRGRVSSLLTKGARQDFWGCPLRSASSVYHEHLIRCWVQEF